MDFNVLFIMVVGRVYIGGRVGGLGVCLFIDGNQCECDFLLFEKLCNCEYIWFFF